MIVVLLVLAAGAYFIIRSARRDRTLAPEVGPVGWVDGTRWAVVAPLARAEVRRLLLHPAFITGVVVTPLILLLAANDDAGIEWERISGGIALGLAPFGWFTIAATQLLTTRPARTGADSLLSSLPAPQPTRTAALLATMAGPVVVATLFAGATVVLLARGDRVLTGSPDLAEIGAGLMLAAGAVTVGVAVGRFLPHPLFAVGGAIAVILIQARFLDPTTWPWDREEASPIRFLGFLASDTSALPQLEYRPAAWHLLYLVGLTAVMVVVALARDGMPRALAGALAVALGVTAIGGWMQTRQAPASRVAEMVSFLEEPARHQNCVEQASGRYCAYGGREQRIAQWHASATAVLALAPKSPRRLVVAERVPTILGNADCTPIPLTDSLIPGVVRAIDPNRVWAQDAAVHPGTNDVGNCGDDDGGFFVAVQVGSWVVGLPSSPRGDDLRCYADGQSRSVLALWLGAAASPEGRTRLTRLLNEAPGYHVKFDWTDPPMWGVHFAHSDGRIALAMLARPKAEVSAALAPQWSRLTAAGTPASELAAVLGLGHVGSATSTLTPACA